MSNDDKPGIGKRLKNVIPFGKPANANSKVEKKGSAKKLSENLADNHDKWIAKEADRLTDAVQLLGDYFPKVEKSIEDRLRKKGYGENQIRQIMIPIVKAHEDHRYMMPYTVAADLCCQFLDTFTEQGFKMDRFMAASEEDDK